MSWKYDDKTEVVGLDGKKWKILKQAVIGEGTPIYFCEDEEKKQKWIKESELKKPEKSS